MGEIEEMLTTRRTDSARLEGAFEMLRAKGYYAHLAPACCSSCGWREAEQHPESNKGALFSNAQNVDDVFEVVDVLVKVDGTWVSVDDIEVEVEAEEVSVVHGTTFQPEATLFLQWSADDNDLFLADVVRAFTAADFLVTVPPSDAVTVMVRLP